MATNEELTIAIEEVIPAKAQSRLYEALEDEAVPFEMRISKLSPGKKLVGLKTASENVEHFARLLHSISF